MLSFEAGELVIFDAIELARALSVGLLGVDGRHCAPVDVGAPTMVSVGGNYGKQREVMNACGLIGLLAFACLIASSQLAGITIMASCHRCANNDVAEAIDEPGSRDTDKKQNGG